MHPTMRRMEVFARPGTVRLEDMEIDKVGDEEIKEAQLATQTPPRHLLA
jgi:hypothetical protein